MSCGALTACLEFLTDTVLLLTVVCSSLALNAWLPGECRDLPEVGVAPGVIPGVPPPAPIEVSKQIGEGTGAG